MSDKKERMQEIIEWLSSDCIDDPEDLFDETELIIEAFAFYIENKMEEEK